MGKKWKDIFPGAHISNLTTNLPNIPTVFMWLDDGQISAINIIQLGKLLLAETWKPYIVTK